MDFLYVNIMSKTIKFFDGLTWDPIVWSTSYEKVRCIQKRIFKASQSGDIKRMWFLQKLLLRNPHAKLVAVHTVTTLNRGRKTAGIDKQIVSSSEDKLKFAQNLRLNGKANLVRRVWIPKPGKTEKLPLGIPTIQDRAKQALCKLALEPEWEAKFEPNSYGFRPGRSAHDAIEAIYSNLHYNVDKYVFLFDADIRKCFDMIHHEALLSKLNTFPLMRDQISAWLKAGIFDQYANTPKVSTPEMGTPQGGAISPLLANIALHGLEEHLLNFVSDRKFPKPHEKAARGAKVKRAALGIIRYADDFVIIHRNLAIMQLVIQETKAWLSGVGLSISEEKSALRLSSQSFKFLGFQIAYVRVQSEGKFRVKITPSKENVLRIIDKVRKVIHANKAASAYQLIRTLRPLLLGWANYFQFCECKETFKKVDNVVYQQLRAWVFRRAIRQGRERVKEKYFPSNLSYKFQGREYNASWILNGTKKLEGDIRKRATIYLPKISWVKSRQFVKVKADASVYDGNEVYWTLRNPRYSVLSTRVKNLLLRQGGKCTSCKVAFRTGDGMEVDHIIPISKGGKDEYINLQLLHRQCHVEKTKKDLQS
uniref:reverse transcriptase intron maturase and HNH endonuclease n=1 Tax=Hydrocytium acuminatum TaxID=1745963 RepID=UPI002A7FD7B6|nr:reverse transcriptase intron maturase and HNH endonuclease [Hydrocytium acuminatum]WOR09529.1 reverse transcriptase intron maturase and HNH endonuclease [Hydrocytium acuminatum]